MSRSTRMSHEALCLIEGRAAFGHDWMRGPLPSVKTCKRCCITVVSGLDIAGGKVFSVSSFTEEDAVTTLARRMALKEAL